MSRLHKEVRSIEDQVDEMAALARHMLVGGVDALQSIDRAAAAEVESAATTQSSW